MLGFLYIRILLNFVVYRCAEFLLKMRSRTDVHLNSQCYFDFIVVHLNSRCGYDFIDVHLNSHCHYDFILTLSADCRRI